MADWSVPQSLDRRVARSDIQSLVKIEGGVVVGNEVLAGVGGLVLLAVVIIVNKVCGSDCRGGRLFLTEKMSAILKWENTNSEISVIDILNPDRQVCNDERKIVTSGHGWKRSFKRDLRLICASKCLQRGHLVHLGLFSDDDSRIDELLQISRLAFQYVH